MSSRALGAALLLPLSWVAGARSGCSQESGSVRWRMAGPWLAMAPNAPFATRLGTRRHQVYLLGLRAERPLRRGGPVELYHTVDVVPLAASTVTPIRYDEVSCDIARDNVAQTDCRRWVPHWGTIYGFGLAPAGLEARYTAQPGFQIVARTTLGVLFFTRPMPDPTAARLNFSVAGDLGVRVGAWGGRAIDVRYRFQHISNGGIAFNPGMNAHMLQVGLGVR